MVDFEQVSYILQLTSLLISNKIHTLFIATIRNTNLPQKMMHSFLNNLGKYFRNLLLSFPSGIASTLALLVHGVPDREKTFVFNLFFRHTPFLNKIEK